MTLNCVLVLGVRQHRWLGLCLKSVISLKVVYLPGTLVKVHSLFPPRDQSMKLVQRNYAILESRKISVISQRTKA